MINIFTIKSGDNIPYLLPSNAPNPLVEILGHGPHVTYFGKSHEVSSTTNPQWDYEIRFPFFRACQLEIIIKHYRPLIPDVELCRTKIELSQLPLNKETTIEVEIVNPELENSEMMNSMKPTVVVYYQQISETLFSFSDKTLKFPMFYVYLTFDPPLSQIASTNQSGNYFPAFPNSDLAENNEYELRAMTFEDDGFYACTLDANSLWLFVGGSTGNRLVNGITGKTQVHRIHTKFITKSNLVFYVIHRKKSQNSPDNVRRTVTIHVVGANDKEGGPVYSSINPKDDKLVEVKKCDLVFNPIETTGHENNNGKNENNNGNINCFNENDDNIDQDEFKYIELQSANFYFEESGLVFNNLSFNPISVMKGQIPAYTNFQQFVSRFEENLISSIVMNKNTSIKSKKKIELCFSRRYIPHLTEFVDQKSVVLPPRVYITPCSTVHGKHAPDICLNWFVFDQQGEEMKSWNNRYKGFVKTVAFPKHRRPTRIYDELCYSFKFDKAPPDASFLIVVATSCGKMTFSKYEQKGTRIDNLDTGEEVFFFPLVGDFYHKKNKATAVCLLERGDDGWVMMPLNISCANKNEAVKKTGKFKHVQMTLVGIEEAVSHDYL